MSDRYYVTTDATGIEHAADGPVTWSLPGAQPAVTRATTASLMLRRAGELVDDLEARIFVAEPLAAAPEHNGHIEVREARLTGETAWDEAAAALFAIDCAEHVLGDAGDVVLPHGLSLASVLADARTALSRAQPDAEQRLGFLARVRAAHRMRRAGATVQQVALELLDEDDNEGTAAIDDPAWTTVAAVVDATLAAVEALRAVALPRYVAARESIIEDTGDDAPTIPSGPITTPWGVVVLGGAHQSRYVPAWVGARDAAARARDVARERGGVDAERAERAFQAQRLDELLL